MYVRRRSEQRVGGGLCFRRQLPDRIMGLRDKQWTTALTISAAAAGISLVAYKVSASRVRCSFESWLFSFCMLFSRWLPDASSDQSESSIGTDIGFYFVRVRVCPSCTLCVSSEI